MINIHIVPCLEDNYAYLIENKQSGNTILVDAPEAAPIQHTLSKLGLKLKYVLLTHHHSDHINGLAGLNTETSAIIGAKADTHRLPKLDVELEPNQSIDIEGLRIEIIPTCGHTIGQLAYYLPEYKILFSADSLMTWGCGRLFEGTHAQAFATLERLCLLPSDTLIYSGHNYGEMGGKFAISLGGDLEILNKRMAKIKHQNAEGKPIVPVALSEEMATNPFLKCHDDDYADALGIKKLSPLKRFTHIRKLRDKF